MSFQVKLEATRVHAGDTLRGSVTGRILPQEVLARWYTEGKGTPDQGSPLRATLARPAGDTLLFELALPTAPRSYDGRLVKVRWQLVLKDAHGLTETVPFEVLAPRPAGTSAYREDPE